MIRKHLDDILLILYVVIQVFLLYLHVSGIIYSMLLVYVPTMLILILIIVMVLTQNMK